MEIRQRRIKSIAVSFGIVFSFVTIAMLLITKEPTHLILAAITPLLVLLPALTERVFRCRISLPVYLFALLYAVGPMLGESWKLYYTFPLWDKLLHIAGGVMFAIVGYCFFPLLTKRKPEPLAAAVFALCFSIAIAAVWEFFEYFMDMIFNMDMQDDMVVRSIHSYLLGTELGVTGSIENISRVLVNGMPLPVDGYIDVGLNDTMIDMLLETVGAVITCMLLHRDGGRHPLIVPEQAGLILMTKE